MNFAGPVSRPVQCPSCSSMAEIKLTKTNHLMLRCDFCKILIFANAPLSQAWLTKLLFHNTTKALPYGIERRHCWNATFTPFQRVPVYSLKNQILNTRY